MVESNKQVFLNFIQVNIKRLILTKYLKFKDKGFFYKNLSSIISEINWQFTRKIIWDIENLDKQGK
jgi:hypothetical protein